MKPRRGKLVVLLAAASVAGLSAAVVSAYRDRIYQWWWNRRYGVPVVETWEELREQPAIELEDGVSVCLGIEATRVPAGRGVLVYCLVDGWSGENRRAYEGPLEPLGPLALRRGSPEKAGGNSDERKCVAFIRLPEGSPGLFARAVFLEEPGWSAAKAVPRLLERLSDPSVEVRRAAAGALASIVHPELEVEFEALAGAIDDPDERVRGAAVERLSFAPAAMFQRGKRGSGRVRTRSRAVLSPGTRCL